MSIKENLEIIEERIKAAAERAGRNLDDIKLVAVTKTHTAEIVDEAISAGAVFIGENKIQEVEDKLPKLQQNFKEWHFIGHLQSNKINKLMKLKPTLIHSIDKLSTAEKLNKYLERNNEEQDVLIQVNTSGEESKFGIEPENTLNFITEISKLQNVKIKGLMTIGAHTSDVDEIRKCFKKLKDLFEEIKSKSIENIDMKFMSMGMTSDFEIAIEEGANILRVGSAIFGLRYYQR